MIKLFEKDCKNFNSRNKYICTLPDVISCKIEEELNGKYELEMIYPVIGSHYDDIKKDRILYLKSSPRKNDNKQAFRIYEINIPFNGKVTIKAEHVSYDMYVYAVKKIKNTNSIDDVIEYLMTDVPENQSVFPYNPFTITKNADYIPGEKENVGLNTTEAVNMKSLFSKSSSINFISAYNCELVFDNYNINICRHRGKDRGFEIKYSKNMTDLDITENTSNVYTGIFPYYAKSTTTTSTTKVESFTPAYITSDGTVPENSFGWLVNSNNVPISSVFMTNDPPYYIIKKNGNAENDAHIGEIYQQTDEQQGIYWENKVPNFMDTLQYFKLRTDLSCYDEYDGNTTGYNIINVKIETYDAGHYTLKSDPYYPLCKYFFVKYSNNTYNGTLDPENLANNDLIYVIGGTTAFTEYVGKYYKYNGNVISNDIHDVKFLMSCIAQKTNDDYYLENRFFNLWNPVLGPGDSIDYSDLPNDEHIYYQEYNENTSGKTIIEVGIGDEHGNMDTEEDGSIIELGRFFFVKYNPLTQIYVDLLDATTLDEDTIIYVADNNTDDPEYDKYVGKYMKYSEGTRIYYINVFKVYDTNYSKWFSCFYSKSDVKPYEEYTESGCKFYIAGQNEFQKDWIYKEDSIGNRTVFDPTDRETIRPYQYILISSNTSGNTDFDKYIGTYMVAKDYNAKQWELKYVGAYIVGDTPYLDNWLSREERGTSLNPEEYSALNIPFFVLGPTSATEYYHKAYYWRYVLLKGNRYSETSGIWEKVKKLVNKLKTFTTNINTQDSIYYDMIDYVKYDESQQMYKIVSNNGVFYELYDDSTTDYIEATTNSEVADYSRYWIIVDNEPIDAVLYAGKKFKLMDHPQQIIFTTTNYTNNIVKANIVGEHDKGISFLSYFEGDNKGNIINPLNDHSVFYVNRNISSVAEYDAQIGELLTYNGEEPTIIQNGPIMYLTGHSEDDTYKKIFAVNVSDYTSDDVTTPDQIYDTAKKYIEEHEKDLLKSNVEITSSYIDLSKDYSYDINDLYVLHLGDIITLKHDMFGIVEKKKVKSVTYDYIKDQYTELELEDIEEDE